MPSLPPSLPPSLSKYEGILLSRFFSHRRERALLRIKVVSHVPSLLLSLTPSLPPSLFQSPEQMQQLNKLREETAKAAAAKGKDTPSFLG